MFTTTNVSSSATPSVIVDRSTFPIMNAQTNHHTLVSSSSTNQSWHSPSQTPTVVSILNGNSSTHYVAGQQTNAITPQVQTLTSTTTTSNIIRQSLQTVPLISPTYTIINNSNTTINGQTPTISNLIVNNINTTNSHHGTCIDAPILGRLATAAIQRQEPLFENIKEKTPSINNHVDTESNQQDPEIELCVNNVVCSFALGCQLNLRKLAMEAAHVIYKRDMAMVLMKIRKPNCSANVWSSGKVTVTGTTSEDDAQRAARRVARSLQRLGYKIKFRNYRVVNCLATCSMPWPIDIIKLSRMYPECVSYEPEIHPGATVRLNNKVVLKVFTTGNITLTAPSVEFINTAVNEFYPQLFECRKLSRND